MQTTASLLSLQGGREELLQKLLKLNHSNEYQHTDVPIMVLKENADILGTFQ